MCAIPFQIGGQGPAGAITSQYRAGARRRQRGAAKKSERSAARYAHVPPRRGVAARRGRSGNRGPSACADGGADRRFQQIVGFGAAQRRAQIGGVVLAQAHIERAGAGDAHAIAALAEIVRERRDEAEPAAGLGDVEIARRAAGRVERRRQREAPLRARRAVRSAANIDRTARLSTSPSGITSMNVRSKPRPCAHSISEIASPR